MFRRGASCIRQAPPVAYTNVTATWADVVPHKHPMTSGGPMGYPGPQPQGLYDPAYEHDACGVAFVADLHGRRSQGVVAKGWKALGRMDHRGPRGAEPNTGDGAGIMIQIPDEFLRAV